MDKALASQAVQSERRFRVAVMMGALAVAGCGSAGKGAEDVERWAVLLRASANGTEQPMSKELFEQTRSILKKRMQGAGVNSVMMSQIGKHCIFFSKPGIPKLEGAEKLLSLIEGQGMLELKLVDDLAEIGASLNGASPAGTQIYRDSAAQKLVVKQQPFVSGADVISAQPGFDKHSGQPIVTIQLSKAGAKILAQVTAANLGKRMAIIHDGVVATVPIIHDAIQGGSLQISGSFTAGSANALAAQLQSGMLPVQLKMIEQKNLTPGQNAIMAGQSCAL